MRKPGTNHLGIWLVVAAAALFTGCSDDAPFGPDQSLASAAEAAVPAAAGGSAAMGVATGKLLRAPDLGSCDSLQVPAGNRLAFRVFAQGVQIYHWNGTGWSFDGPSAVLSADAAGRSVVGTHYAGPTWESMSGGKVVASVIRRCTPDPAAIPWLLLGTTSTEGPGIFHRVTYIQRVNTAGGNAPTAAGSFVGEEARVPYTTEYFFYRSK